MLLLFIASVFWRKGGLGLGEHVVVRRSLHRGNGASRFACIRPESGDYGVGSWWRVIKYACLSEENRDASGYYAQRIEEARGWRIETGEQGCKSKTA